jgi:cytosine/adenosine deaminase-related metal-dependent hydrolase
VASIESLKAGVTSLFDHNSSPNAIDGSLKRIAASVNDVGLRYCGAYEVLGQRTDWKNATGNKRESRVQQGVDAVQERGFRFPRFLHSLKETTVAGSKEIAGKLPIHVHDAVRPEDQEHTIGVYDQRVLERFHRAGLMTENSIYAHCIHTTPSERGLIKNTKGYIVVNCQSNINNGVGFPEWKRFREEGAAVL